MPRETLLEFPCRFPIKAFGAGDAEFERVVFDLVRPHVPDLSRSDISQKASRAGNYTAVTVNIIARDQAQLDAIYSDLSASDAVLMAL